MFSTTFINSRSLFTSISALKVIVVWRRWEPYIA
jgi:hypothetical protein